MQRYIAFLCAINVGGHTVTMASLRDLFSTLGMHRVETFIASGNVIFESKAKDVRTVKKTIEAALLASLGYEVVTFIRTDAQVGAIAQHQPFKAADLEAANALNVAFIEDPLSKRNTKALMDLKTEIDDFRVEQREVYWLCRRKQSDSKFSNKVFEKTLGLRTTFRSFKTVTRLAAKLAPA